MFSSARSAINLAGDTITLAVGPEGTPLKVHESVIRARSDFFKAALGSTWLESSERCIKLPEDKLEIVTLYVQHVYTGKLFVTETTDTPPADADQNLPQYYTLAELYLFGEKIGDARLKNAVLDAFVKRMQTEVDDSGKWYPITSIVDMIYKGTMPGSYARKLMVDAHTWDGHSYWIPDDSECTNKDFLVDLAREMFKKRPAPEMESPLESALGYGTYHEIVKKEKKTRI